jgi:Yip1-like protein
MDSTAPSEKANGLATYFSVLTSPTAAFTQLARTPTWGWAALIGIVLMVAATLLSSPEQVKIAHIAQQQALSNMSADARAQAQQGMAAAESIIRVSIIVGGFVAPWIIWLVSAVVFTIGAAVSGAGARFSLAWVAAVNLGAIAFVGAVVNAIILALRGPDAIATPLDAYALPSLAMLVHGSAKLGSFLAAFNIVNVWYYIASVIALERMLSVKRNTAIATIVIYSLLSAAIAAAFAK